MGGTVTVPCVPDDNSPDEVVLLSEIVAPYTGGITSYSYTAVGASISTYYDGYVSACLYKDATQLTCNANQGNPANVQLQAATVTGHTYTVQGTHSLAPNSNCDDYSTYTGCDDPYGFTENGGGSSAYLIFSGNWTCGEDADDCPPSDGLIELASTSWSANTTLPVITGVVNGGATSPPADGTLNSSGYWVIYGQYLAADGQDPNPLVAASGGGISLTTSCTEYCYVSDGQINVYYTMGGIGSTPVGTQDIVVTTYAGSSATSSADQVSIGDPMPSISSISPSGTSAIPWNANSSFTLTINGSGFGSDPTVSISGTDISISGAPTVNSAGTVITVLIVIAANAPTQTACIGVTSNGYTGYNGNQFAGYPGEPNSASACADVAAEQLPVPQILFNGTNVANNGNPTCPGNVACVVVGQQIALTVVWPQGVTVQTQSWSGPQNSALTNIVGGYDGTKANNQLTTLPVAQTGTCQTFSESCLTFYFVSAGNSGQAQQQVQYNYTLSGFAPGSVLMTFSVSGPTGVNVTGPFGVPNVFYGASSGPGVGYIPLINPGIQLTSNGTNPQGAGSGSFVWVQLVRSQQITSREAGPSAGSGIVQCTTPGFASSPAPELDNVFPYGTGTNVSDSPSDKSLGPGYVGDVAGENKCVFAATMYLLWNSNFQSSIPVPLGAVSWQWACDAVNALAQQVGQPTGMQWARVCAAPSAPGQVTFTPGASFPQWSSVATNGTQTLSCQNQ